MEKDFQASLKTATVAIQVITVDGKRMTKSVFNQILPAPCLNLKCEFIGDELFGFVRDSDNIRYLVWTTGGKLRKTRLRSISDMKEHGTGIFGPLFWNLTVNEKDELLKPYALFLETLTDHQVFISI
jgi:hypothetical protein